jgi:hypothetical protein
MGDYGKPQTVMITSNSLDLCKAYLHASTAVKSAPDRRKPDGPLVTISRSAGARGNSIAEALVAELSSQQGIPVRRPWTVFNQNLVQHVIDEHKLPECTADYFPEDKPDEIRALIGEVLGLHPGVYTSVRKTAETIRRLAKAGSVILVGRGGNFITADIAHSLHVRLVGSEEVRVRHFAKHFGITRKEALAEVKRLDQARKRYVRANFKQNIDDPLVYDLVINTDHFSDTQAACLIASALAAKMD